MFSLLIEVTQGPVAGGQGLVPLGMVVVGDLAGGLGFGVGADSTQGGVEGTEPGPPQFLPGVAGCASGLGGVGVAEQPQAAIGHHPDVGAVGRAESGEGLMPGGPLVGCLAARFRTDGVIGMGVAVRLPVGADRGGLVLPLAAGGRIGRHDAEGGDRPCGWVLGQLLSEAVSAVVHHGRDLGQVGVALGVGQLRDATGQGALRQGSSG